MGDEYHRRWMRYWLDSARAERNSIVREIYYKMTDRHYRMIQNPTKEDEASNG